YNNKNAIINANKPVASAKANPNIAYENNCPRKEGFLDTPIIKAPKTTPIPTPAPINPVVAKPVPIILDACNIFLLSYFYFQLRLPLYSKLYTVFCCPPPLRMLANHPVSYRLFYRWPI